MKVLIIYLVSVIISWLCGRYIVSLDTDRSNSFIDDMPYLMIIAPFIPMLNCLLILIAMFEVALRMILYFRKMRPVDTTTVKNFYRIS